MSKRQTPAKPAGGKTSGPSPSYPVGRNRPPKEHQFQEGVSGNPGGRKTGSLNLKTALRKAVETEVTVTEKGVAQHMSVLSAIMMRWVSKGLQGDLRAIESFLEFFARHCPDEPANDEDVDLAAEDGAVLRRALERRARAAGPSRDGTSPAASTEGAADDDA